MGKSDARSSHNASTLALVLQTIIAEYKSKVLLNVGFIISLALATTTLLAILVLNHASKQQYQQAENKLMPPAAFFIMPKQGNLVQKADYVRLRQLGFVEISPVLNFTKTLANNKLLEFKAVDLLALSAAQPQTFTSDKVLISKALLLSLTQAVQGNKLLLANKQTIPFQVLKQQHTNQQALLDIVLAWQLFPEQHDFSYLSVRALSDENKQKLRLALPKHLVLFEPWSLQQRSGLADALHLNLFSLAILGFIISVFIAFQGGDQAWQQRAQLAWQLRLLGVSLLSIKLALLLEALFLIAMATILGLALALALVSVLLPLLGLTLNQLYSLQTSAHFLWHWQYLLWALLISSTAVLLALLKQFRLIGSRHIAIAMRPVSTGLGPRLSFGITLILLFAFITLTFLPGNAWSHIMLRYGLLLMASVALLPYFLHAMLRLAVYLTRSFRFIYIFQETATQIRRRYLPLAAFYLAFSASLAAALMVNSFELAFIQFIDQQLNADVFIRPVYDTKEQDQQQDISHWLNNQAAVDEYVHFQHTWAKIGAAPLKISHYHSTRQLKAKVFKSKSDSITNGCYINEQLALKKNIDVAQKLVVRQGPEQVSCLVAGVYYDYGYPGFKAMISGHNVDKIFSPWVKTGIGVFIKPGKILSIPNMISSLGLSQQQVFEPAQIKNIALKVFSQTFILTKGIAVLLVVIACFGLFLSANALELARRVDLYILRSLGYSKKELLVHMMMQWLILMLGVMLLSWPIATILAHAIVSQVLPASFGWSMPLQLSLAPYMINSALALLFLLPALFIPLQRLDLRIRL